MPRPPRAQAAKRAVAPAPADSLAAAQPTPARKRPRFGALAGAAASRVNQAVTKAEQTTGVSKETMAKAALTATGVGAAAAIVTPGAAAEKLRTGTALGRELLRGTAAGRVQRAAARAAAVPGDVSGSDEDAELQRLQLEYMQLTQRAGPATRWQPTSWCTSNRS